MFTGTLPTYSTFQFVNLTLLVFAITNAGISVLSTIKRPGGVKFICVPLPIIRFVRHPSQRACKPDNRPHKGIVLGCVKRLCYCHAVVGHAVTGSPILNGFFRAGYYHWNWWRWWWRRQRRRHRGLSELSLSDWFHIPSRGTPLQLTPTISCTYKA